MDLQKHAPLNPFELANHLGIPCIPVSDLSLTEEHGAFFSSREGTKAFSAVTIFDGKMKRIVFNDYAPINRQHSDVAHEISHVVLNHDMLPTSELYTGNHYNQNDEFEAKWMGPALLISEEAAMYVGANYTCFTSASADYNVTIDVMRMRINVCGVKKRLKLKMLA